ncbi:DUF1016 N-terminal domain-containing protein [Candidatus Tisiphia endosymbiont of Parasteatoda lunata]|uniref:DUF1016 N-terminal domain-containing protein n=1 Tax=Candidatus Tisiphia endosymbiont of Parasteatoda lunata TaxID=3066275 RepID=UPI00313CB5F3
MAIDATEPILTRQEQHAWGTKIIDKLSRDLISAFPEMKGFSTRNLKYMRQFAKEYPEPTFVQEVLAQLTWYHNITLLDKIIDKEIRLFYIKHSIIPIAIINTVYLSSLYT